MALSAGISWYSFYLALEYGKTAGVSIALITAINYSSVAIVLLAAWALGRQQITVANIAGVILIVAGVYLVGVKPKPTPAAESPATHT